MMRKLMYTKNLFCAPAPICPNTGQLGQQAQVLFCLRELAVYSDPFSDANLKEAALEPETFLQESFKMAG